MKTLVLFYSYSGKTRALAEKKAKELGADIAEIKEAKKTGKLAAYAIGCFKAMKRKNADIEPLKAGLAAYEKIILMAPIWAGHPAPAFNNIVDLLPAGKKVELIMSSSSGKSDGSRDGTKALVRGRGCEVVAYSDVKTV